jgi:hypothetical protein
MNTEYSPSPETTPEDAFPVERGVPASVAATTAALIVGAPYERFKRQFVGGGLVTVLPDGRIATLSIAEAMGKRITCQAYCLAQQAREPARQYQRDRRRAETSDVRSAAA